MERNAGYDVRSDEYLDVISMALCSCYYRLTYLFVSTVKKHGTLQKAIMWTS